MSKNRLRNKIEEVFTTRLDTNIYEQLADLIKQEKKAEVIRYMDYLSAAGVSKDAAESWYRLFKEATK
jgi:hypothetical protein